MQQHDMDDIAKQLFTMELGHQLHLPASSRPASTGSPLASPSSRRAQNRHATLKTAPCLGKENENTPPRKGSRPMSSTKNLAVPILESLKPTASNDDDLLARKIHKWKLKHHQQSSPSNQGNQISAQAPSSSHQQATPPAIDKWTNIMIGVPLLKIQDVRPSYGEDTFAAMPQLLFETPDTKAKASGLDEPCFPPRRPSLKIRRRPLGRPSPLRKKLRHDE